ncbi:MAG: ion transporter [Alphaproteobacteria bacterium]|nr:ion transporter [Alphaproteobacteria bacterium]
MKKLTTYNSSLMPLRLQLQKLFTNPFMEYFIIGIIVLNSIILGLETISSLQERFGLLLYIIDHICLSFFVIEISLKIFAFGRLYFSSYWGIFDILVIGISLLPFESVYSVSRAFRIMRLFMLVEFFPNLRILIEALFSSLSGVLGILCIILLVMFIFGVIGTNMFGNDFPKYFGNLGRAMFSEFQILTFDDWIEAIAEPVIEKFPFAWIYFMLLIIVVGMGILNLFVSLLVDAIDEQREKYINTFQTRTHNKNKKEVDRALIAIKKDITYLNYFIENLKKTKNI